MTHLAQRSVEHRAVDAMLTNYCQREHASSHSQGRLCIGCLELHSFIDQKMPTCPSGSDKGACVACQKQCMPTQVRQKLKKISRRETPWLFLRHPLLAVRYWLLLRTSFACR